MRYAFVAEHRPVFPVRAMCRCLRIQPSGFYAWLKNPLSRRAREDARQTDLIRKAWKDSGKVYGYRKLHDDLFDQGETCCPNRVARLATLAGIKAQIGYKRRPGSYGGKPSLVADNTLDRQFDVDAPDRVWVTDITYVSTWEGWLYVAFVLDVSSRVIVGWQIATHLPTELVLDAIEMAIWRRDTTHGTTCHSEAGCQFTSSRYTELLADAGIAASIGSVGDSYDNAMAEALNGTYTAELIRRGGPWTTRHPAENATIERID